MRVPGRSRRNFLKVSAGAGGAAMVGGLLPVRITSLPVAFSQPVTVYSSDDNVTMRFPGNEEVLKSSLTVRLEWEYALKEKAWVRGRLLPYWNYLSVNLKVSPNEDMRNPLVDVHLSDHITSWCLSVLPDTSTTG